MATLWMVATSPVMQVVGVLWLAGLLVAVVGSLVGSAALVRVPVLPPNPAAFRRRCGWCGVQLRAWQLGSVPVVSAGGAVFAESAVPAVVAG